uniref:Beta-lactamase-related domain-containing protein n=1 Tax=Panagrolaimus superbus TaxID=310955 RepID=A0A914YFZ6_9BILA
MYRRIQRSDILPRQISHFFDSENTLKYVVLWSNVHTMRFSNPPEIWNDSASIPVTYLKGAPELLTDDQLTFITKRVEHFMKDLDIPGLSVAISKKEQLKFAAGFGYANVRKKEPVTPHHQFRVGSVSKPITAAAILLLVDQGKEQ